MPCNHENVIDSAMSEFSTEIAGDINFEADFDIDCIQCCHEYLIGVRKYKNENLQEVESHPACNGVYFGAKDRHTEKLSVEVRKSKHKARHPQIALDDDTDLARKRLKAVQVRGGVTWGLYSDKPADTLAVGRMFKTRIVAIAVKDLKKGHLNNIR